MLTMTEIDTLVDRIAQMVAPREVIMFGSYAKGRATPRSDLDLLVVVGHRHAGLRRACDIVAAVGGASVPLDVHVVTTDELRELGEQKHSFLHSVRRTGRTLYRAGDPDADPPPQDARTPTPLAKTGLR